MFGQSAVLPPEPRWGRVDGSAAPGVVGVVVPGVDGSVVLGAEEELGSGLAADTTATAPPTRRSAESAPVSTIRLMPEPVVCDAGASAGVMGATTGCAGVKGAGIAGVKGPASPAGHAIPRWSPWFGALHGHGVNSYAPSDRPPRGRTLSPDGRGGL